MRNVWYSLRNRFAECKKWGGCFRRKFSKRMLLCRVSDTAPMAGCTIISEFHAARVPEPGCSVATVEGAARRTGRTAPRVIDVQQINNAAGAAQMMGGRGYFSRRGAAQKRSKGRPPHPRPTAPRVAGARQGGVRGIRGAPGTSRRSDHQSCNNSKNRVKISGGDFICDFRLRIFRKSDFANCTTHPASHIPHNRF